MSILKVYSKADIMALVNVREGEVKLGQTVLTLDKTGSLESSAARFVLLGIPEDIGVRANLGVSGTSGAWLPALKAFLNIQSNDWLHGGEILVLGHFIVPEPADQSPGGLQHAVNGIDAAVFPLIRDIISAGKIPIVIGGGHNNAYPLLKGFSLALQQPVDVLNIDAHADLRPTQGRHSGNGFSYAIKDGFLKHYGIFGLHQSYNNTSILDTIRENPDIHAVYFDELLEQDASLFERFEALSALLTNKTGLEIDLDSIENLLSSAFTPSGFHINDVRKIILRFAEKFDYMHVCEGASELSDGRQSAGTAKAIAYLVSDFIKSTLKSKSG